MAISRASPKRPIGTCDEPPRRLLGVVREELPQQRGVHRPGQSALTRTPRPANSTPSSRESESDAPFDAV